ncbi:hypothetical protein FALBO_10109 [Fusarium albosuccineum]|uniref:Uncharacterized protein n=1 Tax=Fusarium albosuccineum TaxID=1237068 RepID=A0A8H4L4S4_9HYPO|nr:hypothetical protein FALBO_10109 [Fusarium albosuccineum]
MHSWPQFVWCLEKRGIYLGRPPTIPAQEDPSGTYYGIPAIGFYVDNRLSLGNDESQVRGTWLTLLAHVFPPAEGYGLNAEASAGQEGQLDIEVAEVIFHGRREEHIFFVVECKNPQYENSRSSWNGAKLQLADYLKGICEAKNLGPGAQKFGAVSIGKSVQFMTYTYGGNGRNQVSHILEPVHEGVLRLDRQYRTVQRWLDYIKANSS